MGQPATVEKAVLAALEREPAVNLHRWPIRIEYDAASRTLALEGDVGDIAAKRRAVECVRHVPDVNSVVDRLRVRPAEPRGDGAIRASIVQALLDEPTLRECSLHVYHKGAMETLRAVPDGADVIGVSVEDGVIELAGHVVSLSHKRLAGAIAWWAPGCRNVRNELAVRPPEADSDDEIADALRLVLEKDPLMPHADDLGIRVRHGVVTLGGVVASAAERRHAEYDAWYLVGVRDVVNRLEVRPAAGRA